jgi:hypothetical protein
MSVTESKVGIAKISAEDCEMVKKFKDESVVPQAANPMLDIQQ